MVTVFQNSTLTQVCYVCQTRMPISKKDDHLLEHIPKDEEPTGQAESRANFLFLILVMFNNTLWSILWVLYKHHSVVKLRSGVLNLV